MVRRREIFDMKQIQEASLINRENNGVFGPENEK
jgi:hypothetical protein